MRAGAVRLPLRRELGPMAALTFAEGTARLLSFCFYIVAARTLTTAEFGVVRYTIALSLLAFIGLQVVVTGLLRELGSTRAEPEGAPVVIGSALAAAAAVLVVTLVLCVAAGAVGALGSASLPGLLVCLAGLAAFQLYYAAARGLGEPGRALAAYAGGSAAQLLVSGLALAIDPTADTALIVFGLSSLISIVACELYRPVLRGLHVSRAVLERLRALGGPLLIAQAGFLVWLTADQVWVDANLTEQDLGLYGAAKTVSQVFIILPAGVAGALLPRVAHLRAERRPDEARRLVWGAAAGLLAGTLVLALIVLALGSDVLRLLFGADYSAAGPALTGLAFGMVGYATFVGLTEGAVGWGRPHVYAVGICCAAAVEVVWLLLLGDAPASSAAWATAGSMAVGVAVAVLLLLLRPLSER